MSLFFVDVMGKMGAVGRPVRAKTAVGGALEPQSDTISPPPPKTFFFHHLPRSQPVAPVAGKFPEKKSSKRLEVTSGPPTFALAFQGEGGPRGSEGAEPQSLARPKRPSGSDASGVFPGSFPRHAKRRPTKKNLGKSLEGTGKNHYLCTRNLRGARRKEISGRTLKYWERRSAGPAGGVVTRGRGGLNKKSNSKTRVIQRRV